jgi:hypothetical protein
MKIITQESPVDKTASLLEQVKILDTYDYLQIIDTVSIFELGDINSVQINIDLITPQIAPIIITIDDLLNITPQKLFIQLLGEINLTIMGELD